MTMDVNLGLTSVWNKLHFARNDAIRTSLLKMIVERLNGSEGSGIITPKIIKTLIDLIEGPHEDRVKLLTCSAIVLLCRETRFIMLFTRSKLINAIALFIQTWFDSKANLLDNITFQLYMIILKLLQTIATQSLNTQFEILKADVIKMLCVFCCDEKSPINDIKYNTKGKTMFKELTLKKELVGHFTTLHPDGIKTICQRYIGDDLNKFVLPKIWYLMDLYDTSMEEKDTLIVDELVKMGCLRKSETHQSDSDKDSDKSRENDSDDEGTGWIDVCVTSVVDALHFWAVGGAEAMDKIAKVRKILHDWPQNYKRMAKVAPKVGSFVVGYSDICDGEFRAQVVSVTNEKAQLFALDYGEIITLQWNTLFYIAPEMKLKEYKPQAFLCKLSRAENAPMSTEFVHGCLLLMTQMTLDSRLAHSKNKGDEFFNNSAVIDFLRKCISGPDAVLCMQAACVVSNLCRMQLFSACLLRNGILGALLAVCEVKKEDLENEAVQEKVECCLKAVCNMIHDDNATRHMFEDKLQGLRLILNLTKPGTPDKVSNAAHRVLRVFIKDADLNLAIGGLKKRTSIEGDRMESRSRGTQRKGSDGRSQSKRRSHSRGRSPSPAANISVTAEKARELDSCMDEFLLIDTINNVTSESDIKYEDQSSKTETSYHTSELYKLPPGVKEFIWGETVDMKPTNTVELSRTTKANDLNRQELAECACAFLNFGKESSLYYGIQPNGNVIGIDILRNERDSLRIGVDHTLRDGLQPAAMPSQFEVLYHPIKHDLPKGKMTLDDKFVIEIKLKPAHGRLYRAYQKVLCRENGKNVVMSANDLRTKAICEEEKQILEELRLLEKEKKNLEERLEQQ